MKTYPSEERSDPKFWRVFLFTAAPPLLYFGTVYSIQTFAEGRTEPGFIRFVLSFGWFVFLSPLWPAALTRLLIGMILQLFGQPLHLSGGPLLIAYAAAIPYSAYVNWWLLRHIYRLASKQRAESKVSGPAP